MSLKLVWHAKSKVHVGHAHLATMTTQYMLPQVALELRAVRTERAETARLFPALQPHVAVEATFPLKHAVTGGAWEHPHG